MAKFIHILFNGLIARVVWITGTVMAICILMQIFTRTFFQIPFPWTDELARFTFLWFCFTGSVMTLRNKMHLGIDYFESKMPAKMKFANRIFVYSLICIFGLFVGVLGTQLLGIVSGQVSPVMRIPMVWVYLSVPLTGFLYAILGLYQLASHIQRKDDGASAVSDVPADVVEQGASLFKGGPR